MDAQETPDPIPPRALWTALAEWLKNAAAGLPIGDEPDLEKAGCFGPDDDHKVRWARESAERDCAEATREALRRLFRGSKWKGRKGAIAFFARERLEFAARIATAFATPPSGEERTCPPPFPDDEGMLQVIRWMTFDLYESDHFPEMKWRNQV